MLAWLASRLDLGYRIYDRARRQIREEEYAKALWWARILRQLRFSGAYEVEALVFREQGKLSEAASSLEEGIREAPGVWLLHNLLGSTYIDKGRYDEAGLCQGAEPEFGRYNQSVVLRRQGLLEEALDLCPERCQDPELNARARGFRLELLQLSGRTSDVIRLADDCLQDEPDSGQPEECFVRLTLARSILEENPTRALREAVLALKSDGGRSTEAQELIDTLVPESSTFRFAFWFEGTGKMPGGFSKGFLIILVQVVAATQEEALDLYLQEQVSDLRDLPQKKVENRGRFPESERGIFYGPVHIGTGSPSFWGRIREFFRY